MCDTNRINYTAGAMQILPPATVCAFGIYCMSRMNKPWATLIGISTTNISNLNRLRTTICCISISAIAQSAARMARSPTGHRTDANLVLDAVSAASFGYLILSGKTHFLFSFVVFGTQITISNICIQKELAPQEIDSRVQQEINSQMQQWTARVQQWINSQMPPQLQVLLQIPLSNDQAREKLDDLIKPKCFAICNLIRDGGEIEVEVTECVKLCKDFFEELYKMDLANHNGFNPMNGLVKDLGEAWDAVVLTTLRSHASNPFKSNLTTEFIKIFNDHNYVYKKKEDIADLQKVCKGILQDWWKQNFGYLTTKQKTLQMTSFKAQDLGEKAIQRLCSSKEYKEYTASQKLDLLNAYFFRRCQLMTLETANSDTAPTKHIEMYPTLFQRALQEEQDLINCITLNKFLDEYKRVSGS